MYVSVGRGVMVGVVLGMGGADELGDVKKGTKVTVPRVGSTLKS